VSEEPIALDYLEQLRECSLVLASEIDSVGLRFRMLETLREYGLERLAESNELEAIRYRHLSYFLTQAETIAPRLIGPEQGEWLARLEADHDNMRAALDKSSTDNRAPGVHLRLCGALWRFWYARGHVNEGRSRCIEALGKSHGAEWTSVRAKVLTGVGILAWRQSDYGAAQAFLEESLALSEGTGEKECMAFSLTVLGNVAHDRGDYSAARELHEKSLTIEWEKGRTRTTAASLCNLGNVALGQRDFERARTMYEASIEIFRELGDRTATGLLLINLASVAKFQGEFASAQSLLEMGIVIQREIENQWGLAMSLCELGDVACEQGDYASARTVLRQSLPILREIGDRRAIAANIEGFAAVAAALGPLDWAPRMWGAGERIREEIGSPMTTGEQSRYLQRVSKSRAALGDDGAFDSAWQTGREMTLDEVVELALQIGGNPASQTV
jgi:tetratricopeptide (TPR) repeat protein